MNVKSEFKFVFNYSELGCNALTEAIWRSPPLLLLEANLVHPPMLHVPLLCVLQGILPGKMQKCTLHMKLLRVP